MERTPVSSSIIAAIGYHADSLTLEVELNRGIVYSYSGVPSIVYEMFIAADSKGKYFNANIKDRYSFVKV